jgi:hypothetical protein
MKRALALLALTFTLAGCPSYDRTGKLANQDGYMPADQFARYGHEQAEAMAIGREFGRALKDEDPTTAEGLARAASAAVAYARTMPDLASVTPDTLSARLTLQFKSGWRTMVNPIEDGKRGAETPNIPAGAGRGAAPARS